MIMAAAALIMAASCDNAEYSVIDNAVFISEAAPEDKFNQQVESIIVEGTVTRTLTIRLAKALDTDIEVNLGMDGDFIASYNERKGTSYLILPEEYLAFDRKVTIEAGSLAKTVTLEISEFTSPNGEAYAIPLQIESVSGPVGTAGDARHIMFILMTPNIQKAPKLTATNSGGCSVTFDNPQLMNLSEWTLEFWMMMDAEDGNNAFYSNSSPLGFGAFYFRWWAKNAAGDGPWFQNQLDGVYLDDHSHPWEAGRWYHVCYTYSNDLMQLYINGEKDADLQFTAGRTFSFGRLNLCSGLGYMQFYSLAQIRLWNKCLAQSTIQDAMNRAVPVDSPGLCAYWKFDEGSGKILKEAVNGFDIELKTTPTWFDDINFLHPND